ncbi:MAG: hypothetical protein LBF97_00850, partial [Elusimicrobiota bacterium]|nr:hypothetical protein [Elusimicrobiota bacterium]
MKKFLNYTLIAFFFLFFDKFLFADTDISTLEDITVKANLNLQLESTKEKIQIDFDKDKILDEVAVLDNMIFEKTIQTLLNTPLAIPSIIFSSNVISPFGMEILEKPFLTFLIDSKQINIAEWTLIFNDSTGKLFSNMKGKKVIPTNINWDGISSINGNMFIPGKWYSYYLRVKENNNNIITVPGDVFNIKGIKIDNKKYITITLALDEIFDINTNTINFNKNSDILLREALDILKEFFDRNINIIVYDKNTEIAQKRADKILQYLKDNIYMTSVEIQAIGKEAYISDYKIDIIIEKQIKIKQNKI